MSELAQVVQEADAMEDALAAPLFDGVRADVEAVLDGRGGDAEEAWREFRELSIRAGGAVERALKERDEAIKERGAYLRAAGEQVDLRVAADKERDEARHAREQAEQALADIQRGYQKLLAAAESALEGERHAKAQMELRWQAAEKECAALRAQLDVLKKCTAPIEVRICQ